MKTKTEASSVKLAKAIALLVVLGLDWVSMPQASAQVGGSLVVTVTSPGSGSTVTGTIPVNASVTVIGGLTVVGVQFQVDGANLGAEDTLAPYSVQWDTRTATNASHVLTAVARDALGVRWNSDPVTVTVFNDRTSPTVFITAPAGGIVIAGTTAVTAAASDNVGVVGVRFLVDGAAIGAEDTAAPYAVTWDTTTAASGARALSAVARDAAGNTTTSIPVVVTVSQTATRFENTELSIAYAEGTVGSSGQPPNWWHGSRSRAWSGKIASFTRGEGARAAFTFTGTTVRWIGFRAPWAGIARVSLDGAFVGELDLYQPAEESQAVVFARTGLAEGSHTLTVESTGRKNPASVDYAVVVDAFDVAPASTPPTAGTRVEDPALSLTAGWTADVPPLRAWSGGSAALSATPGAQATFTFTGTEVRWIGLRGPQNGIARVHLDGSFHAQVDTYAPVELQTVVFEAANLAAGRHTLTIDVTGDRNAASTGASIVVDALDVRARFEEPDGSITYTPGWRDSWMDGAFSGTSANRAGLAAVSNTAGGRAMFTFTGTSVSWIGARGPFFGIGRVVLDGTFLAEVDTFAPSQQVQRVLYNAAGLTDAQHTLTIEATGTKNEASTASWLVMDAFDAPLSSSAPPVTRFQQTDPPIAYTGAWTQAGFHLWTGESAALSESAGARATFTFTGTAVRWIGQYAFNGGIARVYLDGAQVAVIDTFATLQEEFQAVLFRATDLANASHTLTIEVTGQKNPLAQGSWIFVDAFDIY